jgi:thiosulfate/3-mercaptopyruvate sulfurtransferase
MKRWITLAPAGAAGLMLAAGLGVICGPASADPGGELRAKGRALYAAYCARCHGDDGADTTTYPGAKTLVDITQRLTAQEVTDRSRAFVQVQLEGEAATALFAHLQAFRAGGWPNSDLLGETEWVVRNLKAPKVRIVDMRPAEAYGAGHIPGAVRLEEGPLRNREDLLTYLPRPEAFAAMMSRAGVSNDSHVVIYDDQGGRMASRLWYVLNAYGHDRVSLVNGGWTKWVAEKRPVSTEAVAVAATQFTPKLAPAMSCAAPELLARQPGVVVLDTRTAAEYAGERTSGGSSKAGRIPGAVHVDWQENVSGPHKTFKPAAELRKLYESKGVTPDKEVVTY